METLFHSIQTLQRRLSEAGIPSVVIGGVAVATWGNPCLTPDVDLKVLLGRDDAGACSPCSPRIMSPSCQTPIGFFGSRLCCLSQIGTACALICCLPRHLMTTKPSVADVRSKCRRVSRFGSAVRKTSSFTIISTRARDHEDARSVVHRQGDALDDRYVLHWLRQFERALDDSTLVAQYQQWRGQSGR
jgi:hypothetical protein